MRGVERERKLEGKRHVVQFLTRRSAEEKCL